MYFTIPTDSKIIGDRSWSIVGVTKLLLYSLPFTLRHFSHLTVGG